MSQYREFEFAGYHYDDLTGKAVFRYNFDGERWFEEKVQFEPVQGYNKAVMNRALFLAHILAGISYYKCFPTKQVRLRRGSFSDDEAKFYTETYRDGLSQFVYENDISPEELAEFEGDHGKQPLQYEGIGTMALQSGGKDSLLLAELLKRAGQDFTVEYMCQSAAHPAVIDRIGVPVRTFERTIDRTAIAKALKDGGLNGHVPVTFIVAAYSLVDAVLHSQATILTSVGREGEEPHDYIGDYAIRHQWAKTWRAEQLFADHIARTVSADIRIGSPLRQFSELKIAELFVEYAWDAYGHSFSSCNVGNYMQGHDNTTLRWCGNCPKCANSYLLFAPYVGRDELAEVFGKDLFSEPALRETFMGLLGIDGVMKPFECVGEVDELRLAYHLAQANGHTSLGFGVPQSDYDKDALGECQVWASQMIQ